MAIGPSTDPVPVARSHCIFRAGLLTDMLLTPAGSEALAEGQERSPAARAVILTEEIANFIG